MGEPKKILNFESNFFTNWHNQENVSVEKKKHAWLMMNKQLIYILQKKEYDSDQYSTFCENICISLFWKKNFIFAENWTQNDTFFCCQRFKKQKNFSALFHLTMQQFFKFEHPNFFKKCFKLKQDQMTDTCEWWMQTMMH